MAFVVLIAVVALLVIRPWQAKGPILTADQFANLVEDWNQGSVPSSQTATEWIWANLLNAHGPFGGQNKYCENVNGNDTASNEASGHWRGTNPDGSLLLTDSVASAKATVNVLLLCAGHPEAGWLGAKTESGNVQQMSTTNNGVWLSGVYFGLDTPGAIVIAQYGNVVLIDTNCDFSDSFCSQNFADAWARWQVSATQALKGSVDQAAQS